MMNKTFTLWAACALPMVSPLSAHEEKIDVAKIQADRERLIDLVLSLEADFGQTLRDFARLQGEYASLLNRPAVPDQSGKVKELQKQLAEASAKLQSQKNANPDAHSRALLEQDLVNLRNELHRERQELLVAKAQLLRIKQLEKKNKSLQASLKKETANREKTMGELQAIRGERDALLVQLKGLVARAEKAEKGKAEANVRIGQLEKETNTLKLKLNKQDVELRALRVEQAHNKGAMAAAKDLKKEQERLTALLENREKELANLRKDLATEMKRALDVPVLIKARDDLQKKLKTSNANADGLKKENKALTEKQAQLQKEIAAVLDSITKMQAELANNKKAMATVTKVAAENEALVADRERLMKGLATARTDLAKATDTLKKTEAELAESKKLAASAGELKKQNAALLKQQEVLETNLGVAKVDLGAMQKKLSENQTALKSAVELGQEVKTLKAERDQLKAGLVEAQKLIDQDAARLKEVMADLNNNRQKVEAAEAAMADSKKVVDTLAATKLKLQEASAEANRLKKVYDALNASVMALEKEKAALTGDLAKKDGELKKLRAEMAKMPDMSADVAKLAKEKEELAQKLAQREEDLKKTRGDLGRLQLDAAVAQKQLVALKRQSAVIDPVRYAKGEADVTSQQARVLAQVQQVLKLFPNARFEIVGHTCDLGSSSGNLRLSQQRAKSLHDYLVENGIGADRLKHRGVGQAEPLVPNTSEENRRQNRRVVVEILD